MDRIEQVYLNPIPVSLIKQSLRKSNYFNFSHKGQDQRANQCQWVYSAFRTFWPSQEAAYKKQRSVQLGQSDFILKDSTFALLNFARVSIFNHKSRAA